MFFCNSVPLLLRSHLVLGRRLEVGVVEEPAEEDEVAEVHQGAEGDVVVAHVTLAALGLGLQKNMKFLNTRGKKLGPTPAFHCARGSEFATFKNKTTFLN